jgi:hypothetical protein
MVQMIKAYNILVGKPEGKRLLEDLGVMGRSYQNGSSGNRVGRCGLDSSGSGQGPLMGYCEHGSEPSGYIKGGEFLD